MIVKPDHVVARNSWVGRPVVPTFLVLLLWATVARGQLSHAQSVSGALASTPIPSDISINGTVDVVIPPLLAQLKHDVRNWIAGEVMPLPDQFDPAKLEEALRTQLRQADLLDSAGHEQHPFGKVLGLGVSLVDGGPPLLQVVVSYDGYCPPDDSVLFFEHRAGQWNLLMNFDNTDFDHPWGNRELLYAGISPRDDRGSFFALVVRTRSYCPTSGSVLNSINYYALRPSTDPESPRIILSGAHGYREDLDCRIDMTSDAVTMDFPDISTIGSLDRTYILKYAIGAENSRRIQPAATTPEAFVEEWLTSPWSIAAYWTDTAAKSTLKVRHEQLNIENRSKYDALGDLPFRQTCSRDGKLMLITFAHYEDTAPQSGATSFLVREVGSHVYRLDGIRSQPAQGCSRPEPADALGGHLLPASMNRRKDRLVR